MKSFSTWPFLSFMCKNIILFLLLFYTSFAFGDDEWRPRIREHAEWITVKTNNQDTSYFGFTNTFNYWKERRYRSSFGLAVGPVLGQLRTQDTPPEDLTRLVRIFFLGTEYKRFFSQGEPGFFWRAGVFLHAVDPGGDKSAIIGVSGLLTLGYQVPFSGFEVAPAVGIRIGSNLYGYHFAVAVPFG